MLQNIRDKATGWVAYIIVGLITIPFMFWGIQSYLGAGGPPKVATINGTDISVPEFQRELQQQQTRLREMFGGQVPPELIEGSAIKQSVLGRMVQTEVLRQVTHEGGWRVSDEEVAAEITSSPQFQVNGRFSVERYEQLLGSQRLTKPGYERIIRTALQLEQLKKVVDASGFLTKEDRRDYLQLKGQKRTIQYFLIDSARFSDSVSVSDKEASEYYRAHANAFMTPEKVKVEYLLLDKKTLQSNSIPTEDELRAAYEQEKQRFTTPEERKASHILLKIPREASKEDRENAEKKAAELYKKLKQGADFAQVAKENSDDKLSSENGGELGFLRRGDMSKDFESTLFSLREGEVGSPVKTSTGIEIIKLEEIRGGKQKPFEAVRKQIEEEIRSNTAENRYAEMADQLITLTYENPDSLDVAADELGLKVQTSDWITRKGGKDLFSDQKVLTAIFSPEVLNNLQNSEVIELDNGRSVVLRVSEHQPPAPQKFDQVKDQIIQLLRKKKLAELIAEKGETALERLRKGEPIEAVASELGAKPATLQVDRNSKTIPADMLQVVFSMSAPRNRTEYAGKALSDGQYAVIGLQSVQSPDVTEKELKNNPDLDRLLAEYNDRFYQGLLKALEARQDIQVFSEQLK